MKPALAKRGLRIEMNRRLELLRPEDSVFLRERLHENLRLFLLSHPGIWASYRPFGFEASPLIADVSGVEWVFPRLQNQTLVFHRGTTFEKGPHGILQPPATAEAVEVENLRGVLVPGLAFGRNGARLGRGKGYYDRALSLKPSLLKVGLAHACQIVDGIPVENWDVKMDALITDETAIFVEGD